MTRETPAASMMSKVPAITLAFWVIKISATTLGETGGDALSMTLALGYAVSTLIFLAILIAALAGQVSMNSYHPLMYWTVIVATTTAGTTLSDFLDRTVALGYPLSSALLFAAVLLVLACWRLATGSVSVSRIATRTAELFYWTTIFFSNTLGTALGDFLSTSQGFGFDGSALVFGAAIALIAAAYLWTRLSHTLLFWAAFILTRPLGASLGDLLTKPHAEGGFDLGRITSSLVLAVFIVIAILTTDSGAERLE
ncbi:MAG TPA: hypothetical protein VL993_01295 [Stellaceae bacterium]|nr:hypothetical protein [Stellaceae bacterium]